MYVPLFLLLLMLTPVSLFAQESRWPRYVSEVDRMDIVSNTLQESDSLMIAKTHTMINIYWVTDALARSDVSDAIDKQQLKSNQAEQKYRGLRAAANDVYIFRIFIAPLGKPIYVALSKGKYVDPLDKTTFVMRRGDEVLKGTVKYRHYTHSPRHSDMQDSYYYVVSFPRRNQAGRLFVNNLSDNIFIEFKVMNEKVSFFYPINDLVTRLEEL